LVRGRGSSVLRMGWLGVLVCLAVGGLRWPDQATGTMTRAQAGKVAKVVAYLLQQSHYSRKPFDSHLSQVFLRNYLDALDFNHMVFEAQDIDQFTASYGPVLDQWTRQENIEPALVIYSRFLERLAERERWVQELLGGEQDFTLDESYAPERSKLPWPKDTAEARELWRKRIKYELLQGRLAKEKPEVTRGMISRRYMRLLKEMRDADLEEILDSYLNALTHAYDPHSDYQTPAEARNFEIGSIKLSLSGIGAVLKSEDGYPKIVSLVPGGPADLDKRLKPNDRIVAVQQEKGEPVDVVDMKLSKVVELIRGERGTKVTLTVIPAEASDSSVRRVVTLVRDEVKLTEQRAKARVYEWPGPDGRIHRLGVIILPGFYEKCSRDVAELLRRLEETPVEGVALDLRHNGGGMLEEAVALTGLLMREGPVLQVRDYLGRVQPIRCFGSGVRYWGPLEVLVSRLSASASEIVAAALQDYGRAVIVGDSRTHGKGTVQSLVNLAEFLPWDFGADPGKLKITVQKFYRVTGFSTQQLGVSSDVVLPSLDDYLDIGEAYLPNCLPGDQIEPLVFQRVRNLAPAIALLRKRSAQRIASNPEFGFIEEDIRLLKARLAQKEDPAPKVRVVELDVDAALGKHAPKAWAANGVEEMPDPLAETNDGEGPEKDKEAKFKRDVHLEESLNVLSDLVAMTEAKTGELVLRAERN
jgi:carboxyl-terminal processing protease